MIVFDYVYYRLAKFFFKKDGTLAARAIMILSLTQLLIVGDITAIIIRFFYNINETKNYTALAGQLGGALITILIVVNFLRYRKSYLKFSKKWGDEEINKKIVRGYLVILMIILPLAGMIFLGTASFR